MTESDLVIVDRIATFVERFVYLPNRLLYRLVALWIIGTYLHQFFQYTGYLFISSPEKGCGKTRLLEVLQMLVFNSTGIDSSPTAAVVMRTAFGHTQLLDEGDGWPELSGLRNILNAGFQKNGQTSRCEQNTLGAQVAKPIPVYCPRAIAGIGRNILSETTKDRTLFIEMARQKPSERRERMRERVVGPEALTLKKEIEEWAKTHQDEVQKLYDTLPQQSFSYLKDFGDRTIDISEPLGVVLEIVYRDRGTDLDKARMDLCEAISFARQETNQYSSDLRLLIAIHDLMKGESLIEQPTALVELLKQSEDGWERQRVQHRRSPSPLRLRIQECQKERRTAAQVLCHRADQARRHSRQIYLVATTGRETCYAQTNDNEVVVGV